MEELKDNKIIIGGYGSKGGATARLPKEVPEGVNTLTGSSGTLGNTGIEVDLTKQQIEVLDLLSEGEIHGLVTGTYNYSGTLGNVGWGSVTFVPNTGALGLNNIRWLQSVYWNDTPLADEEGKFNFQQIIVKYSKGSPNGSNISDDILDELSISRIISERLRGGGDQFAKVYRILNQECIGVNVNIRVTQLQTISSKPKTLGDVQQASIDYNIYYRPIFYNKQGGGFIFGKAENITGKITSGYIRSTRINFNRDYSNDPAFIGWEIKIVRSTEDSTTSTLRNQTFIDSLTEFYGNKYIYPNSAIFSSLFDSEYFSAVPERKYLANLLKVKVPSNYDPILKTYDESSPWDGTFKTDGNGNILKQWTDNPAWCYYDLLSSNRYGLGLYIDEDLIDKISLYEVSKYCDVLVPDGYGGLEPRFTCNLILNSADEAYKVINTMASIFRAIIYYSAGSIYVSQDSEKTPLYQFTNANVVNGDFTYSSSAKKARHTVAIIRYNDKTNFYKPTIEYVENVEGIRNYGIRDLDIPAIGCTSRGQAIRLGRWALLTESLETESISFQAGLEASFLRPGDIFQVFDANRNNQRLGGRLYSITALNNATTVTLDSQITGLAPNFNYSFALLTPSFYYDSSLVTGLNTNDLSDIRRNQIQYFNFTSNNVTYSGDKSIINVNTAIDYTNYNVSGNLIWMIEASGSNITGLIRTDEWETYRVLNIKESDDHIYEIAGLQYNQNKFNQIESGFSFSDSNPIKSYALPPAPTNLQLYTENIGLHSQLIHYKFIPPDVSNISNFRVFTKTSAFVAGDQFNATYLINELPNTVFSGTYLPADNGIYYFRVYSVNYQGGLSSSFASGDILISNVNPIQDVTINSLQLVTGDLFSNAAGTRYSGIYSEDSPNYAWQVGIGTTNFLDSLMYRITARSPSLNNTPTNHIYYEITGYQSDGSEFTFDFEDNFNSISNQGAKGPFREYDLVVEAMTTGGFSSAGGNFTTNLSQDSDYSNANGYDILYCNNPQPRQPTLYTGTTSSSFYATGYATQQWITQDGEVKMYFSKFGQSTSLSDWFGDDIAGSMLYYSDLPFTQAEAKQQIPANPPEKVINNIQITTDNNPVTVALGLFNSPKQYIAIAPFDSFDQAINNDIPNYLITGLNISNVVSLNTPSLSNTYRAWVELNLDLDYINGTNRVQRKLNPDWIYKSYNILNVQDISVLENGQNITRGVITFENPLPTSGYAIVKTDNIICNKKVQHQDTDTPIILTYFDSNSIHLSQLNATLDAFSDFNPFTHKLFIGVMYSDK